MPAQFHLGGQQLLHGLGRTQGPVIQLLQQAVHRLQAARHLQVTEMGFDADDRRAGAHDSTLS